MTTAKILLIFFAGLGLLLFIVATKIKKHKTVTTPILAKVPLTKNEQPMYFRLVESFPNDVVLAQVAFSALLKTSTQAARNKFDRKVADFVLCTKSFDVLAVIELDDSSHNNRQTQDKKRDELLESAGYRVIRFKKTPDIEALRVAIATQTATKSKDSTSISPPPTTKPTLSAQVKNG